ncbi:MAG: prepilin-type N-terminal cleavage/methylation domain-containing protein [Spartobacteria bacterium]|nr:prepilin-type N-terminal cleavage/methylation domain-containing protein [Spartobacteria bacterium]
MKTNNPSGFTIMELMIVVVLITLLTLTLSSVARRTLESSRQSRCASNLRQIQLANITYENTHGYFAPAAADIFSSNLRRWHGRRTGSHHPFDGEKGPLAPYMGAEGAIRACPTFVNYVRHNADANTFEASCGGYGYNDRGVGSQAYLSGYNRASVRHGMPGDKIKDPSHTVAFADTAFPQPYSNPRYLIEYSFAEAYHFLSGSPPRESGAHSTPSIHFRHNEKANVVWVDGHVSAEELTTSAGALSESHQLGWFGGPDNQLFDPY